jgi:hypothetical protein
MILSVKPDMAYKKIGIFVKTPSPGASPPRLSPPLSPEEACNLHRAFVADLIVRVCRLKKVAATVFYAWRETAAIEGLLPAKTALLPQRGDSPGEKLDNAFQTLLLGGSPACVIGSDSPDVPLAYIKRAFVKLKHRDVVLGPSLDGGCYLIGLRKPAREILRGISLGEPRVLDDTLARVESQGLSLGILPPWYGVGGAASLSLLKSMMAARRIAGGERLPRVERALSSIRGERREG